MTMVRPLTKTYDPANPFAVERHDREDGSIVYEVWDQRPDSCRRICVCAEDMIATALNQLYGTRPFRSAELRAVPKK